MILLDTNVLSAMMRNTPDTAVVQWLDGFEPGDVWTTSITVFEIRFGLQRRAGGRETSRLGAAFEALITEDLAGRIAAVDTAAAEAAGRLAARREAAGRAVDSRDTLIAGIALARHAAIATRNIRHFTDLDIAVIDPWSGSTT